MNIATLKNTVHGSIVFNRYSFETHVAHVSTISTHLPICKFAVILCTHLILKLLMPLFLF